MKTDVYQIYFKPEQIQSIEGIPLSNIGDDSGEYEYGVMRKNWKTHIENCDFLGYLSWKFRAKTSTAVNNFYNIPTIYRGYDCYCLNPFLFEIKQCNNVWLQGETCHKGIIGYANEMLTELFDIDYKVEDRIHNFDNSTFCNYFIGNLNFWTEYTGFMDKARQWMIDNNDRYNQRFLAPYDTYGVAATEGFYPYIIERLFTEFLFLYKDKVKIKMF